MRISDWSSDVCSSDLRLHRGVAARGGVVVPETVAFDVHEPEDAARRIPAWAFAEQAFGVEEPADRGLDHRHPASTQSLCAVQKRPSSEARNRAIAAMSAGWMRPFRNWAATISASPSGVYHCC